MNVPLLHFASKGILLPFIGNFEPLIENYDDY